MSDLIEKVMNDPAMPWRVVEVTPADGYQLIITFIDGRQGVFDCTPYLEKGVFKRLKDPEFFKSAHVAFDSVCWSDDIDIAPERLYTDCKPLDATEWE